MHKQPPRRAGLTSRYEGKLLRSVNGLPRGEYDLARGNVSQDESDTKSDQFVPDEVPDEVSEDSGADAELMLAGFATRSPGKKAKNDSRSAGLPLRVPHSTKSLAQSEAPSISKAPVSAKPQSRRPSVGPKSSRSVATSKDKEEAVKDTVRPVRGPGIGWDKDDTRRKPLRTYGSKASSAPRPRAKRPLPPKPTEPIVVIDSGESSDSSGCTSLFSMPVLSKSTKPSVEAGPRVTRNTDTSNKPSNAADGVLAFIDPKEKYALVKPHTTSSASGKREPPVVAGAENTARARKKRIIQKDMKDTVAETAEPVPAFIDPRTAYDIHSGKFAISDSNLSSASPSNRSVAHESHEDASGHSDSDSESARVLAKGLEASIIVDQDGQDKCKLCSFPLPSGYLDKWTLARPIRFDMWMKICRDHKNLELQDEWTKKEYPDIQWEKLPGRIVEHLPRLKKVISKKTKSHFRSEFAKQFEETGGLTRNLLRLDHKLPFPGYYGPRGGAILMAALTDSLGEAVGRAAMKDSLIARSSVGAFIQHVLVLELAVQLIADDMGVSIATAQKILEDSQDIGEKLNPVAQNSEIYNDGAQWRDINATQQAELEKDGWEEFDY